jgi:hypothetical protein
MQMGFDLEAVESDYQEEILKLLPQKVRAILKLL